MSVDCSVYSTQMTLGKRPMWHRMLINIRAKKCRRNCYEYLAFTHRSVWSSLSLERISLFMCGFVDTHLSLERAHTYTFPVYEAHSVCGETEYRIETKRLHTRFFSACKENCIALVASQISSSKRKKKIRKTCWPAPSTADRKIS